MNECAGVHGCPECTEGKHGNCHGDAWCVIYDRAVACSCYEIGHDVPAPTSAGGD